MSKEKQLVKIDPKEYGLESTKAKEIEAAFKPMLQQMVELENEYNEIIKGKQSPELAKKARELRLKYVKVRTGTAKIHKELKAFYLAGGRFVDGWKNAQLFASQGIEEALESIEKHEERLEEERKQKLKEERVAILEQYDFDGSSMELGEMEESIWNNFIAGVKLQFEAKKKEEEEERKEQERLENIESMRKSRQEELIRDGLISFLEFDGNIGEIEGKEFNELVNQCKAKKKEKEEEDERIRQENERLRKEEEKRQQEQEKLRKLREERNAEIREKGLVGFFRTETPVEELEQREFKGFLNNAEQMKKQHEEELAEKARLQKEEEERLAKEAEEKARQEELAKAPDKEKLKQLAKEIALVKLPVVKSAKAKKLVAEVHELLGKVGKHIEEKVEKI